MKLRSLKPAAVFAALALLLCGFATTAHAQTNVTTMHSFADGSTANDGVDPESSLIQATDGSFYGTSYYGGAAFEGSVYKISPAGVTTTLHSFGDGTVTHDGMYPVAGLIQASDGNFYGETNDGGSDGVGAIYKITTKGVLTIIHSFNDGTVTNDGSFPEGGLIQATDGNLYGTTVYGGANGDGMLFKVTTGGSLSIEHSFGSSSTTNDGQNPFCTLFQASNGSLYGTTYSGGSAGYGTVFKATTGGSITILHSFNDGTVTNDGRLPVAGVILGTDGNLYGTTQYGGVNGTGIVFKTTTTGTTTILTAFGSSAIPSDGSYPYGNIIQGPDGGLYGTTTEGGDVNYGTVYKVSTDGSTFVTLHSFRGGSSGDADGAYPIGGLVLSTNGSFYGTTETGGSQDYGTVFRVTMGLSTVHTFSDGSVAHDGGDPSSSPIQAADGNFYGVTEGGGSKGYGSVYKTTPAGVTTILHSFSDGTVNNDGQYPFGAPMQGSDGNLYGMTEEGGKVGSGTIFKVTLSGAVTILHSFGDGSVTNDGADPLGSLVQGKDGNLYGLASEGGANGSGVMFKVTTTGKVNILHSFSDGSVTHDGSGPESTLLLASDGNFYGVTQYGGAGSYGTVFEATSAGTVYVLHSFSDGGTTNDGRYPYGGLVEGAEGSIYGTTEYGGTGSVGTIYRVGIGGGAYYSILHNFDDGSTSFDGEVPIAGLNRGPFGSFYGTTYDGGTTGYGTIFQMLPTGSVIVLHTFNDGSVDSDGTSPRGGLTFANDGNLYGTVIDGGGAGFGTEFKYAPTPPVASIQLSLTTLTSGKSTTGTFSFNGPAQVGGAFVCLSTTDPAAIVPSVVEVPEGATAAFFPVMAGSTTATKKITISATAGNSTKTVVLTINPVPDVASVALNPTTVIGGSANSSGTVTLNLAAPTGGLKVTLASRNTSAATVPSWVNDAAGATTATFTVTSKTVSTAAASTITATGGGTSATAVLTVNPAVTVTIKSIVLSPTSVAGGHTSTATVTLTGPAPVGGLIVNFKSSNTAVVPTPAAVTIAAGGTTHTATVTTKTVSTSTAVTVEAYNTNAGHQTATLTVTP